MVPPGQAARAALACAVAGLVVNLTGCAHVLDRYPGLVLPWEELPEKFHWVVSVGPSVNYWDEAPPGVADLFFGLRVGLHLGTSGEHHIPAALAERSWLASWASHTYFRFGFPLVPDNLFVSPLGPATGLSAYGVNVRLTSIGTHEIGRFVRFGASIGVVATYLYLETTGVRPTETHFLRPGFDLRADLEVDWGASWFVGIGWSSMFHLPQRLGTSFENENGNTGGAQLWHIGQGFVLFSFRLSNEGAPTND